jgi:hypothetical protein
LTPSIDRHFAVSRTARRLTARLKEAQTSCQEAVLSAGFLAQAEASYAAAEIGGIESVSSRSRRIFELALCNYWAAASLSASALCDVLEILEGDVRRPDDVSLGGLSARESTALAHLFRAAEAYRLAADGATRREANPLFPEGLIG